MIFNLSICYCCRWLQTKPMIFQYFLWIGPFFFFKYYFLFSKIQVKLHIKVPTSYFLLYLFEFFRANSLLLNSGSLEKFFRPDRSCIPMQLRQGGGISPFCLPILIYELTTMYFSIDCQPVILPVYLAYQQPLEECCFIYCCYLMLHRFVLQQQLSSSILQ